MGYIYMIRNKKTGKAYIGETIRDATYRWKQHIQCIKSKHGCPALRDAFIKYGIDSFEFKVLIICFDEDRFVYEKEYIAKYNTQIPNGYNILPGGIGGAGFKGKAHTEEVKNIIRNKSKANWNNMDDNEKDRIRNDISNKVKALNISERMKISEKWKDAVKHMSEKRRDMHMHSPEIKNKIRDSVLTYYKNNPNAKPSVNIYKHREIMCNAVGRPIEQYDLEGNLIQSYRSISEAGRTSSVKKTNIQQVLKGNTKTAGNFIWKYATKA